MIGGPGLYAVMGVWLSRKIQLGRIQEGHNDVLVPIFLNAGVLFAVLLGFLVVAVWESYDAAKENVAIVAAALVPLYRATLALPKDAGDRMREISREYVHEVIEDEWATQSASGQASSKARKQVGNLFRAFGDGTISPEIKKDYPFICTTLMQSINEVTNYRNKRNIQANEGVPTVMWFAIYGGSLVIVSMSCIIYMERPVPHMIMAATMARLIGLLLFSCLIRSQPFRGPVAVSPESFEKTVVVFDYVDRGN